MKRLFEDLMHLGQTTRDPIFRAAAETLKAYGVHNLGPKSAAKRLQDQVQWYYDERSAIEFMFVYKKTAERAGEPFSARQAAEHVAAKLGLPGASFSSVTQSLRSAFSKVEKGRDFFSEFLEVGDTGDQFLIIASLDDPADAATVASFREAQRKPNNLRWRQDFFNGRLLVRYLAKKNSR